MDRGSVRLLDLVFLNRGTDGCRSHDGFADLDGDGKLDLAVFKGVASGVIQEAACAKAGTCSTPGSSAAIIMLRSLSSCPSCDRAASQRRAGSWAEA